MSNVQHTVSLGQPTPAIGSGHVGIIKRALVQVHPLDLHREPIMLSASRLTIGRDSTSDLVITDQSVSRLHAEIRLTDQGAVLLDLDSTNGVSVNGARTETQVLVNGDYIQVGTFLYRYLATASDLEPLHLATVYSMMTRDGLTRVFNRRYLSETLRREVARCKRYARPISVIMVNVDQFAAINERFGTMIGDQALRQVARRLENILREDDVLARTAGDTFAIALVEAELEEAAEIAERCRMAVASEPIVTSVGPIRMTISLGIAARQPQQIRSGSPVTEPSRALKTREGWGSDEELMAEAMDRLREAKRAGRNRTVC